MTQTKKTRKIKLFIRKLHKNIAMGISIYFLLIVVTGIILLFRSYFSFIQPPTVKGTAEVVTLEYGEILELSKPVVDANIKSWKDISQIRVYYAKGYVLVRAKNGYQIQLDGISGKILSQGSRLTPLLIRLHEGTWFGTGIKNWIFIPASFLLLFVLFSGVYMFFSSMKKIKLRSFNLPKILWTPFHNLFAGAGKFKFRI